MKRFGLVGHPVKHSYSQIFFRTKFEKLGLTDHCYDLFELEFLNQFPALWLKYEDLVGVNVTVPHKEGVLKYLDSQDASAIKVGAANVILRKGKKLIGYNTDYMAFKESLETWMGKYNGEALILGTGGASKAVQAALSDLNIPFNLVSRTSQGGGYTYGQIQDNPEILERFLLIVNTTPLGMHPEVNTAPQLPYTRLSKNHFLYDLVYNPEKTEFLQRGESAGTKIKNGLEMLELQAERSWEIWNK